MAKIQKLKLVTKMRGKRAHKEAGRSIVIVILGLLLLSVPLQTVSAQLCTGSESGSLNPRPALTNTDSQTNLPRFIRLKAATFDPLIKGPNLPSNLAYRSDCGYFLIQCKGPISMEQIAMLKSIGATVLGYVPDYAYVVYLHSNDRTALDSLSFIRWVGAYEPAYKIQPGLLGMKGEIQLRVIVFDDRDGNLASVRLELEALGGEIQYDGSENGIIRVLIDADQVEKIARIPEVQWIDLYQQPTTFMNKIRVFTGADSVQLNGFNGSGIVGEVKDSGIDLAHPDFAGQILATDGTIVDDPHGTPVFGIVFSSGANDAKAKGMMPGGQGVFCSWEEDPLPSMQRLVNNWGGVFQSNSWSTGDATSSYNSASYEHDQGVFEYDITVLHSAGNSGITPYTCSNESVGKNVIAVGALFHFDTTSRGDDQWLNAGPGSTPAWGPAEDGRIKPDLSGPFDQIYTTDSVDGDGEPGYDPGNYTATFGGTSGATPVVAGAAGLTYQMFKENHFGNNPAGVLPHASTVKALLIANAYQYDLSKAARTQQGWGGVDIGSVYNVGQNHFIVDEPESLTQGESTSYFIAPTGGGPMKITLVWTDVPALPGANPALVNNLDLKVKDPSGNIYWGNHGLDNALWSSTGGMADSVNNVENVFIPSPSPGTWSVEIFGTDINFDGDTSTPQLDQTYSLVASRAKEIMAVNFTSPQQGVYLSKQVAISGISTGNAQEIEVKINDGTWDLAAGTATWSLNWDTTLYPEGPCTVYARAYDGLGYSEIESLDVIIDNAPPVTTPVFGSPNHFNGTKWFILPSSSVSLSADEAGGSGVAWTKYRIFYEGVIVKSWTVGNSFFLTWGEGNYTLEYYSEDFLANTETVKSAKVMVDVTSPKTTLTIGSPSHRNKPTDYWNVSYLTDFTLSPVYDVTGVYFKWYKINGIYYQGDSFNLLGLSEGIYTVEWGSRDHLGNNETGNSQLIFLDRTAPNVQIVEGDPKSREYSFQWWNVTNTTPFTIIADDEKSGISFSWYTINGNFSFGSNFTLNGYENGTYVITYGACDNVGNNRTKGPFNINLDTHAPITQIFLSGPQFRQFGEDVLNVSKTTLFELLPFDMYAGVSITWYKINGAYHENPYNQHIKFDLSSENDGFFTISWASRDNLSQEEEDKSQLFYLDSTPPDTDLHIGEPKYRLYSQDAWNVTMDTEFTLKSHDNNSGVNLTWFKIGADYYENTSFNLSGYAEGYYTITWGAMDNLGNAEAVNSQVIYLVVNPHSTSIELQGEKYRIDEDENWNVTQKTIFALSPPLVNQGIDFLWYSIDGNLFFGANFTLSGLSQELHVLSWGAVDFLGRNESGNSMMIFLDDSPPMVELSIGEPKFRPSSDDSWAVTFDTKFTIISFDNHSKVAFNWFKIDGKYFKGTSFTLKGHSQGEHILSWGAQDNLKNNDTAGNQTVILDTLAPTITIHIGEPNLDKGGILYITSSTKISFSYRDDGINLTRIFFSLDEGSTYDIYTTPFTVVSTTKSIYFIGEDALGNEADESYLEIRVDNRDYDSDGTFDLEDDDDDNDGLLDTQEDINGNGKVDSGETDPKNPDSDGDGHSDGTDSHPLDSSAWNGEDDSGFLIPIVLLGIVVVVTLLIFLITWQKRRMGEGLEFIKDADEHEVSFQAEEEDVRFEHDR